MIRSILLAIASVALTLLVAEGLFRLAPPEGWNRRPRDLREDILNAEAPISAADFNVYYFGGSSMKGVPYEPAVGIPQLVDAYLGGAVRGRRIRAVNLGWYAEDLDYAAERARVVLAHRDDFHPALFVVYSGHNEYSEHQLRRPGRVHRVVELLRPRSALVARLTIEPHRLGLLDRRLIDAPLFEPGGYEAVLERYEQTLRELDELTRAAGVPVVISTVVGNETGWDPNRSLCDVADDASRAQVEEAVLDGWQAVEAGTPDRARAAFGAALRVCPDLAEAHFGLGRAQALAGEATAAHASFVRALEEDGWPIRVVPRQNEAILALAPRADLLVVDGAAAVRARAPAAGVGFELMTDAHHPNLLGYSLLSRAIAVAIADWAGAAPVGPLLEASDLIARYDLDDDFRFAQQIWQGRWFARLATLRWRPDLRLDLATRAFEETAALRPVAFEPPLGFAVVAALRGDADEATAQLDVARARDAGAVRAYLEEPWVRDVFRYGEEASMRGAGQGTRNLPPDSR